MGGSLAQVGGSLPPHPIENPALNEDVRQLTGLEYIQRLVPSLVSVLFISGVVIFFFVLVLGAIQWIGSGGDKANIESARSKVTMGFVGLVLLLSVFAIVKFVEEVLGISILELEITDLYITG